MMATQQMNAGPPRSQDSQQGVQQAPSVYPDLHLPGAFPAEGDFQMWANSPQHQFNGPNQFAPQIGQASNMAPRQNEMQPPTNGLGLPGWSTAANFNAMPGNMTLGYPIGSAQNPYDVSDLPSQMYLPGAAAGPSGSRQGAGGLSSIINRTNRFDLANGLDDQGQPLPEYLANFMQNAAFDSRISDQELKDLLDNITPEMEIPAAERNATVPGLIPNLYHHQELALKWMAKLEEGKNKGGILADDMGLGKTVSTLSLILTRPAKSRPKTNLIIGPVALARQWEDEIIRKTNASHRPSVFIYHKKKATTTELLKFDVVITTYNTVAREHQKYTTFVKENADRNIDYNDKSVSTRFPLFNPGKAMFHRIILDEAQCIKNRRTQTAQACHALYATYRWCLTGTPMMNSVEELFSLIHFLRIKPYSDWIQFNQVSCQHSAV